MIEIAAREDLAWLAEASEAVLLRLDKLPENSVLPPLPAVPVIGVGSADHPLAACLDCIVEPPASIAGLAAAIRANPGAASVLVTLMRRLGRHEPPDAIALESLAYGLLQGSAEHRRWYDSQPRSPVTVPPGRIEVSRDGGVLNIVMDRPWARNAIDVAMRDGLFEACELARMDDTITSVRLTGRGKAFSVGADLSEFGTTTDPATAHLIRMRTLPALAVLGCADRLTVRIGGAAVGAGIEIAAFARRIEARSGAYFHLPELRMGLIPGAGGCVSISRRIGRQRLLLMALSGRRISARLALEWGLIDAIVD